MQAMGNGNSCSVACITAGLLFRFVPFVKTCSAIQCKFAVVSQRQLHEALMLADAVSLMCTLPTCHCTTMCCMAQRHFGRRHHAKWSTALFLSVLSVLVSNAGSRPASAKWTQNKSGPPLTASLQEQLNEKMGKLAFAGVTQVKFACN